MPPSAQILGHEAIYCKTVDEWNAWLNKNHDLKKEIWFVQYKKRTSKPSVPILEAQDEAMCFGWVESRLKRIDDERHMLRFTPRVKKSVWNEANVRRAEDLIAQGRMHESGMRAFDDRSSEIIPDVIEMPADLESALNRNTEAWENFNKMPPSHKKHYFYWINDAKRPGTRERRISTVLKMAAEYRRMGT